MPAAFGKSTWFDRAYTLAQCSIKTRVGRGSSRRSSRRGEFAPNIYANALNSFDISNRMDTYCSTVCIRTEIKHPF